MFISSILPKVARFIGGRSIGIKSTTLFKPSPTRKLHLPTLPYRLRLHSIRSLSSLSNETTDTHVIGCTEDSAAVLAESYITNCIESDETTFDENVLQNLCNEFINIISNDLLERYITTDDEYTFRCVTKSYIIWLNNIIERLSSNSTYTSDIELTTDQWVNTMKKSVKNMLDDENNNYQQMFDEMKDIKLKVKENPNFIQDLPEIFQTFSMCYFAYCCDVRNLEYIKNKNLKIMVQSVHKYSWMT